MNDMTNAPDQPRADQWPAPDPVSSGPRPVIVWFRRDLRVADNPALAAAAATGAPVIPLYVHDPRPGDRWAPGAAALWWLDRSLASLAAALAGLGSPLVLRRGPAAAVVEALVAETGAVALFWNDRHEPALAAEDTQLRHRLTAAGVRVGTFNASSLFDPARRPPGASVAPASSGGRGPARVSETDEEGDHPAGERSTYRTFAAFWRRCQADLPVVVSVPEPVPARLPPPVVPVASEDPAAWGLAQAIGAGRAAGLAALWTPGEPAAVQRLARFLDQGLATYHILRNDPDKDGTSRLSPHLAFGEIGPRQVLAAALIQPPDAGADVFLRELGWREYCRHLLYHRPDLPNRPLRSEFAGFPWVDGTGADGEEAYAAWREGRTGYPIVDAGMRELRRTGWLHNRVRMIVASFLVKDLLLPWQLGEAWFWDALVDADLASNAVNWQWVAGCGVDAAPYFRIFNPVLQGEKFDPRGRYVRRSVPELARIPDLYIHRPWESPPYVLAAAGLDLGRAYPRPIIDHALARRRALSAYQQVIRTRAAG